jgi:hypothetical protein
MYRDYLRLFEQSFLADQLGTMLGGLILRQVLAPRKQMLLRFLQLWSQYYLAPKAQAFFFVNRGPHLVCHPPVRDAFSIQILHARPRITGFQSMALYVNVNVNIHVTALLERTFYYVIIDVGGSDRRKSLYYKM